MRRRTFFKNKVHYSKTTSINSHSIDCTELVKKTFLVPVLFLSLFGAGSAKANGNANIDTKANTNTNANSRPVDLCRDTLTASHSVKTPWADEFLSLPLKSHPLHEPSINWQKFDFHAAEKQILQMAGADFDRWVLAFESSIPVNMKIQALVQIVSLHASIKSKINIIDTLNSQIPNDEGEAVGLRVAALELKFRERLYRDKPLYRHLKRLLFRVTDDQSIFMSTVNGRETQIINQGFSPSSLRHLLSRWVLKAESEGVNLGEISKKRLEQIDQALLENGKKFRKNALASLNQIYFLPLSTEWDQGVPETVLDSARELAFSLGRKNDYAFYLRPQNIDQTHFILEWATDANVRHDFFRAFTQRGLFKPDNTRIAKQSAELRLEKAKILGYKNFAEYRMKDNMLNHPSQVMDFVNSMKPKFVDLARRELADLKTLAPQKDLASWDVQYLARQKNQRDLGFDPSAFKPYLELNLTLEKTLAFIGNMMGVKFQRTEAWPAWHKDVIVQSMTDAQTGQFLGIIYFDLIQRPQKPTNAFAGEIYFPGAYSQGLNPIELDARSEAKGKSGVQAQAATSSSSSASFQWHPGAILVNLSIEPSKNEKGGPDLFLMDIKNLQSLFHEVGHAIHFLVSKVPYPTYGSFSAPQDFLELPSQFLENFGFDADIVEQIAEHYESHQKPSRELLEKLPRLRNLQPGLRSLARRGLMTELDMAWHTIEIPFSSHTMDFEAQTVNHWKVPYIQAIAGYSASNEYIFTHGYEAQFYGYQWSEVLDYDLYRFFMNHTLDRSVLGQKFRKELLEKGGWIDAMADYVQFKGSRPESNSILLKYLSSDQ